MPYVLTTWCQVDCLTIPIRLFLTRGFSNPHFFITEIMSMNTSQCLYTWSKNIRTWAKGNALNCSFCCEIWPKTLKISISRRVCNTMYRCSCGFTRFGELLTDTYQGSTFHCCLIHHTISTVLSWLCRATVLPVCYACAEVFSHGR